MKAKSKVEIFRKIKPEEIKIRVSDTSMEFIHPSFGDCVLSFDGVCEQTGFAASFDDAEWVNMKDGKIDWDCTKGVEYEEWDVLRHIFVEAARIQRTNFDMEYLENCAFAKELEEAGLKTAERLKSMTLEEQILFEDEQMQKMANKTGRAIVVSSQGSRKSVSPKKEQL